MFKGQPESRVREDSIKLIGKIFKIFAYCQTKANKNKKIMKKWINKV